MKRRGLVAIIAVAMSFPVGAAAQQSEQSLGSQQQTYTPSLAVVMGLIQTSHFKLLKLAAGRISIVADEGELARLQGPLSECGRCRHQRHSALRGGVSRRDQDQGWRQIRRSLSKVYGRVQQLPQSGGSGIYQNKGAGDVTDNDLTPKQ